ncbi:hypothetical protein H2248_011592 [Termitomyces sp. 'cryptogamus']|nr:hypothetical protein H2248_011592 [Termitomyces sp. 'cryptogamus']
MVFKKSLWKQISQTKDKQLVLEARKSFFNEALPILSGKLSDAKAIEELKEKAEVYFKESQARKEAQEVNKGQAAEGVAGLCSINQSANAGSGSSSFSGSSVSSRSSVFSKSDVFSESSISNKSSVSNKSSISSGSGVSSRSSVSSGSDVFSKSLIRTQ